MLSSSFLPISTAEIGTDFENVNSRGGPGERLTRGVSGMKLLGGVTIMYMLQIHSTRYLVSRVSDRGGGEWIGGWF